MAATPQSQAINETNDLLIVLQSVQQTRSLWLDWRKKRDAANLGTIWAAWPTAAQNADGSLGAADGTPVGSHPIDTRIAGVANLLMPRTPNDLANMSTLLDGLEAFINGGAVTQANREGVLGLARAG